MRIGRAKQDRHFPNLKTDIWQSNTADRRIVKQGDKDKTEELLHGQMYDLLLQQLFVSYFCWQSKAGLNA